jgi:hypothetical protein
MPRWYRYLNYVFRSGSAFKSAEVTTARAHFLPPPTVHYYCFPATFRPPDTPVPRRPTNFRSRPLPFERHDDLAQGTACELEAAKAGGAPPAPPCGGAEAHRDRCRQVGHFVAEESSHYRCAEDRYPKAESSQGTGARQKPITG